MKNRKTELDAKANMVDEGYKKSEMLCLGKRKMLLPL